MKRFLFLLLSTAALVVSIVFYQAYLSLEENEAILWFSFTIFSLLLFILAIIIVFRGYYRKRIVYLESRLAMWNNISYHVNEVGDEVVKRLPVGVLVLDETFVVKWENDYVREIFTNSLINKNLISFSSDLFNNIQTGKKEVISIAGRQFDFLFNEENRAIFLFDVSSRERALNKYNDSILALGILHFDNLDESLISYDVSEQSNVKAELLSVIFEWVERYNGFLKLFADDRLLFITNRKQLKEMIAEKFSLLDSVREISEKHNLKVTISIGIASWDISFSELGGHAQNAVDLAEKRGGDQVVVNIQNQKIEYFGAKSDTKVKSSKVAARINAGQLKDLIEKASNVIIMGHTNTDVDALGAALLVNRIAESLNIKADIVFDIDKVDTTVKDIYNIMCERESKLASKFINTPTALSRFTNKTLLVVVDVQMPLMVSSPEILAKATDIAVLDHHRVSENAISATFNYIETSASSSVELITELLAFFNKEIVITSFEASVMYAGLIVDTSSFTNRTSSRTFEVASRLKEMGADTSEVKSWLRKDLKRTLEISKLMAKTEIFLDKFAFVVADEAISDRVFLAQVSDQLLAISGISASFTLARLDNNMIGISARSYPPFNVQIIMEALGGGGHLQSAAAQIENTTLREAKEKIKQLIGMEYDQRGGNMKVILTEEIKGRGLKEDVIEVANGYGQFLISNKKAILATNENLENLEKELKRRKDAEQAHIDIMKKLKSEIDGKSVTVFIQVGNDGKLFGSVTSKQIADAFDLTYNIKIDKKKIELSSEINSLGIYQATVMLYKNIKAQFDIHVTEK